MDVHTATILSRADLGPAVVLRCASVATREAKAGQYVVIHSDVPNPEKPGQVLKRAWSFARFFEDGTFDLLFARVAATSGWLAGRAPGDTVRFTGPWGRFLLDDGAGPVACFATDTAISPVGAIVDAALATGRPVRLWWQTAEDWLPERIAAWRDAGVDVIVGASLAVESDPAARWFLAGNGAAIEAQTERLGSVPPERIQVERFFTPRPVA
jgi:ferredoxin-NADP reductase